MSLNFFLVIACFFFPYGLFIFGVSRPSLVSFFSYVSAEVMLSFMSLQLFPFPFEILIRTLVIFVLFVA